MAFTGPYINITANPVRTMAGALLNAGWIQFTPRMRARLGSGEGQAIGECERRPIANGQMLGTLRLGNPAQSDPINFGYDIQVHDADRNYTETYQNVAILADDSGNWNFADLDTGAYTKGVPYSLIKGDKGDPGEAAPPNLSLTAQVTISAFTAVANGPGGARPADSTDPSGPAIGVAVAAALASAAVPVQYSGPLTHPGWNWNAPGALFVGLAGALTQTPPINGFIQAIGRALTATEILIDVEEPIPFA